MHALILKLSAGILLIICTVSDLRTGTIRLSSAVSGTAAGMLCRLLFPDLSFADGFAGIMAGAGLLIVSWLTREAIGRGDCYVLCAIGALEGFFRMLEIFFFALLFSAAFAVVLLLRKKADRKTGFPFMPFLLAAQVLLSAVQAYPVLMRE